MKRSISKIKATKPYGTRRPVYCYFEGKRFVWNDRFSDFVRFFRRNGRVIPLTLRETKRRAKRLTGEEAAQYIGNLAQRKREVRNLCVNKGESVQDAMDRTGEKFWDFSDIRKNLEDPPIVDYSANVEQRKQAKRFVKERFGIDAPGFDVFPLEVVQSICQELVSAQQMFGSCGLIDRIDSYGSRWLRKRGYFNSGEKLLGSYIKNLRTLVFHWNYDVADYKAGVAVDELGNKHTSTQDWRHAFRHEIGHAIVNFTRNIPLFWSDEKESALLLFYQRLKTGLFKNGSLSVRSQKSVEEMICESIAQMMSADSKLDKRFANKVVSCFFEREVGNV